MPDIKEEKDALESLSPRDLITHSSGVFNHPMLCAIAEAASPPGQHDTFPRHGFPSPKAADTHMQRLGFPNEICHQVRTAVYAVRRIKEHSLGSWIIWKPTTLRPADAMLGFPGKLTEDALVPNISWKFAGAVNDCRFWPALLREYCAQRAKLTTTVDYEGSDILRPELEHDAGEWPRDYYDRYDKCPIPFGQWQFTFLRNGFTLHRKESSLSVCSRVVGIQSRHADQPFPGFYKLVELANRFSHFQEEGGGLEQVRIKLLLNRIFSTECDCHVGYAAYERLLLPDDSWQLRMRIPFALWYKHPGRFSLVFDKGLLNFQGKVLCVEPQEKYFGGTCEPRNRFNLVNAGLMQDKLLRLAEKFFSDRRIELGPLLGHQFLDNPPKQLCDLFITE